MIISVEPGPDFLQAIMDRRIIMSDLLVTEYQEPSKKAKAQAMDPHDMFHDDDFGFDPEELVVTFTEEPAKPEPKAPAPLLMFSPEDVFEFSELDSSDFDIDDLEAEDLMEEGESETSAHQLPGAVNYTDDDENDEEEEEEPEEKPETDWKHDRDPSKFMAYVLTAYPSGIPSHDGRSTLGCERAILYLTHLNKEISEALRTDSDDTLDLDTLEKVRVNMVRDVVTLKEHIKKLNKKHKKASEEPEIVKGAEIKKEASTPRIQLVMTPFERAITGMIVNSVVSAGKPFEDVYDNLKEKYAFTDREELSIMQLLMDMGHPIFKDRGTIGEKGKNPDGQGVDFLQNYFA